MTNKPYYSDPLDAAWMIHHYDMEFDFCQCGDEEYDDMVWPDDEESFKCCIDSDSVKLLEPQMGDLLQIGFGQPVQCGYSVMAETMNADGKILSGQEWLKQVKANHPIKIIQRNGVAFMWPRFE